MSEDRKRMRFLVTAGPTREPIDPVRFLSNRSSGKMGYALALAALGRGHEVVLISGPVALRSPAVAELISVETALEMFAAVESRIQSADAAIFCAAVADYRPVSVAEEKIKKTADHMQLELTRNPDILGSAREQFGFRGILVGFAAETNDLEFHARGKLLRKGCDLLVANDVSRSDIGFGSEKNEVTLFFSDGDRLHLACASKQEIAEEVIREIEKLIEDRKGASEKASSIELNQAE